jgi:excisionase family DNA binding protein
MTAVMARAPLEDRYLTLQQLARYSSLSVPTLRRRLRDAAHPLPYRKAGRRILVRRSAFDRWLAES